MIDISIRQRIPFDDLNLSKCQAEVLAILLSEDRWWTTWHLWEKLQHSEAGPEVVKVFVFHLKRKLKTALGDDELIRSQHARGYCLTEHARRVLLNWNTSHAAEAA
jgi:DNA-binding response OmpR family regulator